MTTSEDLEITFKPKKPPYWCDGCRKSIYRIAGGDALFDLCQKCVDEFTERNKKKRSKRVSSN